MKLTIDNLQGQGPVDYTANVDTAIPPRVVRKLNAPSGLALGLLATSTGLVVPVTGARVVLTRANGTTLFTGYLTAAPRQEHLGIGQQGQLCAIT